MSIRETNKACDTSLYGTQLQQTWCICNKRIDEQQKMHKLFLLSHFMHIPGWFTKVVAEW